MASYCSPACLEAPTERVRHASECASLRALRHAINDAQANVDDSDGDGSTAVSGVKGFETRLHFVVSLCASLASRVDQCPEPEFADVLQPALDDVLRLCGDTALFRAECDVWAAMHAPLTACMRAAGEAFRSFVEDAVPTPESLAALVCREECNSFGFWDDGGGMVAYGLYPHASFLNHSCVPNAYKIARGRAVEFRATARIPAGEEVCISYVQVTDDRDHRNVKLVETYKFSCACERCVQGDGGKADADFRSTRVHGSGDCGGLAYVSRVVDHEGSFCTVCGSIPGTVG